MIDLKKYGLLYRLHCLQGTPVIEGDDLEALHTYFHDGLVAGDLAPQRLGMRTLELTPDGQVLVQVIKRQIRFSIARILPQPFIHPMHELPLAVLEQELTHACVQ